MLSICSLLAVFSLAVAVNAEVAPAGQPVQLTIGVGSRCLAASGNTTGSAVIAVDCNTSDLLTRSWTVTKGGSTGNAPASTITIFGGKFCLDVKNGINADGTKLQIFDCVAGNTNQLFKVHSISDTSTASTITWSGKNKCVDLTNGDLTPGNIIQVWTCSSGNTHQLWNPSFVTGTTSPVTAGGATRFELPIPAIHEDGCMTATDSADGSPVIFHRCTFNEPGHSGPSEVWTLTAGNAQAGAGPIGQITNYGNKCLDVTNGSTANGVKLQIFQCFPGNANQMFQVNADFTIRWVGKGKCADLTNGNLTDGNPIQSWDCTFDNHNQQWIPGPV